MIAIDSNAVMGISVFITALACVWLVWTGVCFKRYRDGVNKVYDMISEADSMKELNRELNQSMGLADSYTRAGMEDAVYSVNLFTTKFPQLTKYDEIRANIDRTFQTLDAATMDELRNQREEA